MVRAILIAPRIKHGHGHHVVLFRETPHTDDILDQGRHIISHALRSRALQHDDAILLVLNTSNRRMAVCDTGILDMLDCMLLGLKCLSYVDKCTLADGAKLGLTCSCCQTTTYGSADPAV